MTDVDDIRARLATARLISTWKNAKVLSDVYLADVAALLARVDQLTAAGQALADALEDTDCGDMHYPHDPEYCNHGVALVGWRAANPTSPEGAE